MSTPQTSITPVSSIAFLRDVAEPTTVRVLEQLGIDADIIAIKTKGIGPSHWMIWQDDDVQSISEKATSEADPELFRAWDKSGFIPDLDTMCAEMEEALAEKIAEASRIEAEDVHADFERDRKIEEALA